MPRVLATLTGFWPTVCGGRQSLSGARASRWGVLHSPSLSDPLIAKCEGDRAPSRNQPFPLVSVMEALGLVQ